MFKAMTPDIHSNDSTGNVDGRRGFTASENTAANDGWTSGKSRYRVVLP